MATYLEGTTVKTILITMKTTTIALIALVLTSSACANEITNQKNSPSVVKIPVVEYNPSWKCPDCTPQEQYVLELIQEKTKITDKNSLATIMGNIKQESKFISNICEGGSRVTYNNCHVGGYGLIQWTSIGRYKGLGAFAQKYGCDPSTLECQTRYMINEKIFQTNLPVFEGNGQSISYYMKPAYRWLGWGIKGRREVYAYDYIKKFVWS